MTKHYTELGVGFANDPDSVNLHLCLPDHVLTKMDGVECAPDKTPLDNPHPRKAEIPIDKKYGTDPSYLRTDI
jgi:hypothetical protein